jgi:quercetin dioxygenase-like cupin family protein
MGAEWLGAMLVSTADGSRFEDRDDKGRVLVFGRQTGGRYSLMEFVVSPRPAVCDGSSPEYGPHRHREIEETFLVRRGKLHFLLGEDVFEMGPGDFVRVPAGTRHGFANLSGQAVDLLVSFHPGGFEELFLKHRTDQEPPPSPTGFVDDATKLFASEFEG